MAFSRQNKQKIIAEIGDFDRSSGSFLERLIFNNRLIIIAFCAIITCFLGFQALHLKLNANFDGTIPVHNPFMVNYLKHFNQLESKGNALRIVVKADNGTIASAKYLATLEQVTNSVLDLPGIDRPFTTSLWTPQTRWIGVDQGGIINDAVIPDGYDGSPHQIAIVMQNIRKTGRIGDLVGTDFRSSMIYAPLMNHNGVTGGSLDYGKLARDLTRLRTQYAKKGVTLYITGFAMVVGDMILGIKKILMFFAISAFIAGVMLFWFTRSARSTFLVLMCTIIAVIWQLGLLPVFGYNLDPYSVLVPFLIFAIGMSHGAQKMNGVMQDIARGTHREIAARYTFRRLFVAGLTALMCDAVGFGVLYLIDIQEIKELAITASCGVAILIFTNLILLPILLSYIGVSKKAAIRSLGADKLEAGGKAVWPLLARFTRREWALPTLAIALILGVGGIVISQHAQIGDVGVGAPELRQSSQYNQDNRYIEGHYGVSSSVITIFADSKPYTCTDFTELSIIDRLDWRLEQMPEVQSVTSMSTIIRFMTQTMTDDSPAWNELVDSQPLINDFFANFPLGYDSLDCSFIPINVSLYNLDAKSLRKVVDVVQTFIANRRNRSSSFSLSLAGGNGGIAAATDRVIEQANNFMLVWIYAAVAILCFITFRSWLAVLCAILPLLLTSLLCQSLMVALGIGITVATLPVVALGVGIGVDYALYLLGVMMVHLREGVPLEEAYLHSLKFTGRVVMLTGLTLAVGVGTWIFAPIKFQADMGILLAFMFLWNMFGALVLLPALASILLRPSKTKTRYE